MGRRPAGAGFPSAQNHPLVTRLHRYEMYQWADHIQWDRVDRVILVSRAKEREFAERFPDHAGKVVVIPEAISLQRFQPHSKPFGGDMGILCHLSPRKRVYELILAFSEISRRHRRAAPAYWRGQTSQVWRLL
jgi:glycosyltransferase involved in cell wall biosynthesis